MAVLILLKINLINDIDDLTEQDTILHVVVIILKSRSDNNLAHRGIFINFDAL